MKRFVIPALLPLLCAVSSAQPGPLPPSSSEGVSEDDAVLLALRSNPDLRAFRKQRDIAEGAIISATAIRNPSLQLQALHVEQGQQMGFSAGLKWVPPQPVAWSASRSLARAHLREVGYEIAEREWALATLVRLAYATVSELRAQERVQEEALTIRRRIGDLMRVQVARGQVTRIDQNLAELAIQSVQRGLDDIVLRSVQAQAELKSLMGVLSIAPIGARRPLAGELEEAALPESAPLADRAIATRPLLKAAQAQIAQRTQAVRIEQTRRWPWMELSGSYSERSTAKYPSAVQLGIELTLPVFNTNTGPIQVALAQQDQQQALMQAQTQALIQTVYASCAELKARQQILQRYRREVLPVLAEHERLMETAARGAQVDLVALLSSEESVLRSRREYLDARLGYRRAWLLLEGAVGAPLWEEGR